MFSKTGWSSLLHLIVVAASVAAQDCRTNRAGYSYAGNVSTTTNGCTCRPWTDAINTRYVDSTFPDGSKAAAGNRCRNPGAEYDRPWCYIVNSSCALGASSTSDYCDGIPVCSKTCRETAAGTEYNGAVSQSSTGAACLSWTTYYPANYVYLFTADATIPGSVCRNIAVDVSNPSSTNFVPWCLTNAASPTPSNCSIPFCSQVNPGGCRTDQLGSSYRGNQSTSVTGKTCIRWDTAPAVYTTVTWPVSGETITAAANYCRNPNNSPVGLWCLVSTTDWEPCVVPVCVPISGCPSPQSDSYKYKDSITYSGCVSWSGLYASKSSSWYNSKSVPPSASAIISQPLFHPGVMPDLTLAAAADYCRNPDNDITGPWCPTSAGTKQYCANPCYLTVCMTDTQGLYYAGTVSVTRLNVSCQSWISKYPINHPYATSGWFPDGSAELAKNYCRTPDQNKWGPWCYKSTYNGTGSSWDYCTVPYCTGITTVAPTASASTENCRRSTSGTEYAGTMSTSASGKTCVAWTSNTALHTYYLPQMFNAASITDASNYCRNPDASTTGPWCYVDATTRENCNVPMCSSTTVVTAPGTTDPVMVIVTGIIGMIGLTTTLALAGSLMVARTSPGAVQDSVVPQSTAGQKSAVPRLLPPPPQPDPLYISKKKTIKTTVSTNETTDAYDTYEQAAPLQQNPPLNQGNGATSVVNQTVSTVTTQSAMAASATRGGGGGDSGYSVTRIVAKPDAASAANAARMNGASGGGGSYSQSSQEQQHAMYRADGSSGGRDGRYIQQSAGLGSGGGGGAGGVGYTYTEHQSFSSGGGGASGYISRHEGRSGQRNGQYGDADLMGLSMMGQGGYVAGGAGGFVASNEAYRGMTRGNDYASRSGGSSDRYSVSVATHGGGGVASRSHVISGSSSSAAAGNYGMSSSFGGVETRERRSSIVDESLGSYLQSSGGGPML